MFTQLYTLLKSDHHYNVSIEIEILNGLYSKVNDHNDIIKKALRKYKYKQ
jgi:hypothetical protein